MRLPNQLNANQSKFLIRLFSLAIKPFLFNSFIWSCYANLVGKSNIAESQKETPFCVWKARSLERQEGDFSQHTHKAGGEIKKANLLIMSSKAQCLFNYFFGKAQLVCSSFPLSFVERNEILLWKIKQVKSIQVFFFMHVSLLHWASPSKTKLLSDLIQ
jgi:hypothetical protein